tara:strand:+ start:79 stop:648 length:570 start_codon:yes stop_codon:yes gene_type:complete
MKMKYIILLSLHIFLISCNAENNIRTYKLEKENVTAIKKNNEKIDLVKTSDKLIWDTPASWIPSSGSSMRIASFSIPYLKEKGDLSVIKLEGDGGGLALNVNRWRKQLNLEELNILDIEKNIVIKNGKLGVYKVIQIINNKLNSAFLCAIITLDQQTIFVKLAIKPKGIELVKNDFYYFCSSFELINNK